MNYQSQLLRRGIAFSIALIASLLLLTGSAVAAQVECGSSVEDDGEWVTYIVKLCDPETGEQVGETREVIGPSPGGPHDPNTKPLEAQTTSPYARVDHLHFVGGQAVIAGQDLEPEYQYAIVYESANGNRVTLANSVTSDGYGNFSRLLNTPNWLLHGDWGTVEAVPLGSADGVNGGVGSGVPPEEARVGRSYVTAAC